MLAAGTRAGEVGIPVLLDPVGVGASRFRRETAGKLLDAVPVAVIRGNASEIKTLVLGSAGARGVDADITDQVTQENLEATAALAQTLAGKTGAVVALTGAVDVVTDGDKAVFIRNGHPMMCRLTGMGCQLSGADGSLCGRQSGQTSGRGRRRRLRHGALRRNGLCPAVRAGRDGFLWGVSHGRHFPPDAGGAGERSQV